ncbi:MAG: hypothetical protein K2O45_10600, partial [Oscillospiraceae bacterium]|nr:hypothetical protein [Oscillospiraceae bacterium]
MHGWFSPFIVIKIDMLSVNGDQHSVWRGKNGKRYTEFVDLRWVKAAFSERKPFVEEVDQHSRQRGAGQRQQG